MGKNIDRVTEYDIQTVSIRPPENKKPVYKIPQRMTYYDNKIPDVPKSTSIPIDFTQPTAIKKQYKRLLTFILTEGSDEAPQEDLIKCPWSCDLVRIDLVSEGLTEDPTELNIQKCNGLDFENGVEVWENLVATNIVMDITDSNITIPTKVVIRKDDYLRINLVKNGIDKPLTVELVMIQEI